MNETVSIKVEGMERLTQAMAQAPQLTTKEMVSAMTEALIITQREVVERTPTAWGNLAASITHQVQVSGGVVTGEVGTNAGGKKAPYALWVEEDTRPHMPPLEPLIAWVRKKGLSGAYSLKTRRRLGSKTTQAEQDKSMAYMIALKIKHHGTKGRHMFREGLTATRPEIQRIFNEAIDDLVGALGQK